MAKNSDYRRSGSATRTVYTGGPARQLAKPIYGNTPGGRVGGNSSSLQGAKIQGCNPKAHTIGEPRKQ